MFNTKRRRNNFIVLGKSLKPPINRLPPAAIKARILTPSEAVISDKTWDQEYDSGKWDYLSTTQEFGRYSVISGYCEHLKPGARVLDVGCGSGILAHWLSSAGISSYVGVDLSAVAIEQARRSNFQGAEFDVADASIFETSRVFDVIVFNEMLYYLKTPEKHVRRIARALAPDGILSSVFGITPRE